MKKRVAESLAESGCKASVEEFRSALAEVKARRFAAWSIDELCYTRDEAAEFCRLVKERLGAPRLTRPFLLRSLVGLRKSRSRLARLTTDAALIPRSPRGLATPDERAGKIFTVAVPDCKEETLMAKIEAATVKGSVLYADEFASENDLGRYGKHVPDAVRESVRPHITGGASAIENR